MKSFFKYKNIKKPKFLEKTFLRNIHLRKSFLDNISFLDKVDGFRKSKEQLTKFANRFGFAKIIFPKKINDDFFESWSDCNWKLLRELMKETFKFKRKY